MKKKLLILSSVAALAACSPAPPVETVSVDIDPTRETPDTVLMADREIIVLETHPEALLYKVQAFDIYRDKLYILDQRGEKIHVFDRAGNFLSTIGRRGRGPGAGRIQ